MRIVRLLVAFRRLTSKWWRLFFFLLPFCRCGPELISIDQFSCSVCCVVCSVIDEHDERWWWCGAWEGAANTSERMVGRVNAPTRPQHTPFNVLVLQMPDGYGVYQHTLLTWVSVMKCNPTMARSTWSRFSRRVITWDFPLCAYTSVRKLTRWKHWELTFPFLFLIHNHKIR